MQDSAASLFEIELRSANPRRHWSPASQSYAPADVLLGYLTDGWNLSSVIGRMEYWYGAGRHVDVYYFELARDHRMMVMPVHGNPAVHRLVWERQLRIMPLGGDYRPREGQASEVYSLHRAAAEYWMTVVQKGPYKRHTGERRHTARLLSARQRHLSGANANAQQKTANTNRIIEQKERTMTTDPVIKQLTNARDSMARQISIREKKIAHFSERLKSSLMPNQVAMLQAQRARQVTMLDADRGMLVNLEASLAAEIAGQS
jgi:hypothetical protein